MGAGVIEHSSMSDGTYDFIYSFHMPLFFLLSGIFNRHSIARRGFLADKVRTILYPYVLWSLMQGTISMLVPSGLNDPLTTRRLLVGLAVDPIGQFWYLWTLFALCLLVDVAHRAGLEAGAIFAAAVGLWAIGFWPTAFDALGLMPRSLCRYGIYFGFGFWMSDGLRKTPPVRSWTLITVAMLGFAGAWVTREWRFDLRFAPLAAAMGIVAVLAASHVLELGASLMNRLGRWSLPIYLGHVIAAAGVRIGLLRFGVTYPPVHLVVGTTIGLGAPALLGWARDFGYLEWLFALRRSSRPSVERADALC